MVATGGAARGSRLTASRVLELDDDKSDESTDHEDQNEENDRGSSLPFGGRSGSEQGK